MPFLGELEIGRVSERDLTRGRRIRAYSTPGKRGGAWVFRGTRTPVSGVFENLQDMSVEELVEELGVTREQVEAVLQFAALSAEPAASRP